MRLIRCKLCPMPVTRPDTQWFDGICSACLNHKARAEINWRERERDFCSLLERTPRSSSGYDCIVASSGGKDSHWQVLKLLELGAKPLIVTAQTCHLTEVGRRNISNLSRFADTKFVSYNPLVRGKLNKIGLGMLGDISWPEHVAIFSAPFRVSVELGIPLVFYGECPQNAYGGPAGTAAMERMTKAWIHEFGGHLGMRAMDMVGQHELTHADMEPYELPQGMDRVHAYFMGAFFEWDSVRNAKVAAENGMVVPPNPPCEGSWWRAENLDNAQTGIHDWFGYLKFGYGRLCAQLAIEVRYGLISREIAMDIIRERDGAFPMSYMGVGIIEMLHRAGISYADLLAAVREFRNAELFCGEKDHRPILHEFADLMGVGAWA